MKTSDKGIKFIEKHEGLSLKAYKDVAGYWTTGYGHLIKLPREQYFVDVPVTQALAEALLKDDIESAEECVNKHVTIGIDQCQFDALVDFVFNLGCNAFERSTLLLLLNKGERQRASEQFMKWNKIHVDGQLVANEGLTKRRTNEANLFMNGNYDES